MSKLFSPLQIKNISLKNRIVMSPMCQYSSTDGYADDWFLVHYGSRAIGGCGAIIQEATAVVPEGRITFADLGIWSDAHIEKLKKITDFISKEGCVPGIQLTHAGRKASCDLLINGGKQLQEGVNAWQTVSASDIPFHDSDKAPISLSKEGIQDVVSAFKDATVRSIKAGYKIIEIHAAHGYLIHQFCSPLSNQRTDEYGGSFENRIRLLLEIVDAVNEVMKADCSLWVRISATDWKEGGWDIEESVRLTHLLKERGVDVMDVSTGGNIPHAKIPVGAGYQVPFAKEIKKSTGIITGAVGLIDDAHQAEELLSENACDLIFLGRKLLRDPYFGVNASIELKEENPIIPSQYLRGY